MKNTINNTKIPKYCQKKKKQQQLAYGIRSKRELKRLEILGFGCERAVSAIAESAKHKVKGAKTIFGSRSKIKERFISTIIQIGVCDLEIRVLKWGL